MTEVRQVRLTYGALPYVTHPIDTVNGPQGWGPFTGAPYTPLDYLDATTQMGMAGISTAWTGSNNVTHGPGYHDLTIFQDKATASVANQLAANQRAGTGLPTTGGSYSSTISNSLRRVAETKTGTGGTTADLVSRLSSVLKGGK